MHTLTNKSHYWGFYKEGYYNRRIKFLWLHVWLKSDHEIRYYVVYRAVRVKHSAISRRVLGMIFLKINLEIASYITIIMTESHHNNYHSLYIVSHESNVIIKA